MATTIPLIVGAAPFITPIGDSIGGSAIGQTVVSTLTNPYVNVGLTSMGLTDATHKIYRGDIGNNLVDDAMTALELSPLGYVPLKKASQLAD